MDRIWELSAIVDRLLIEFQVIAFFLMTTGFILRIRKADTSPEAMLSVVATALVLLGLMASQSWWFKETQGVFFTIADQIKADYETHPFESMQVLRQKLGETEHRNRFGHILSNVRAAVSEALLKGFMSLLIGIASVLQILFTCLYCILIEVFRLLFPLALSCYMFEGLRSLGFQFVLKTLSVMAWPVGFAFIERIAQALQVQFYMAPSATDRLHGGILFPLMLCLLIVGGTLKVPSLMSSLFSGGDIAFPANGLVGSGIATLRGTGTQLHKAAMYAPKVGAEGMSLAQSISKGATAGLSKLATYSSQLAGSAFKPTSTKPSDFTRASNVPVSFTQRADNLVPPKSI